MRMIALLLLILLAAVQRELWSEDGGLPAVFALQRQIDLQLKENARLRERNQALDAEVHDLKQGLEAIEERARSEMGMVKEGGTFYQIVDVPDPSSSPEHVTANNTT